MKKNCNANNPKSLLPEYECNPKTGRWIKKKTTGDNKKKCNANNPKSLLPEYECNPKTGRWIKKKIIAKTELQQQNERRQKERKIANQLAKIGRKQYLEKYPLLTDDIIPSKAGIWFPLKEETQRIIERQKVKQAIRKEFPLNIHVGFPYPVAWQKLEDLQRIIERQKVKQAIRKEFPLNFPKVY